MTIAGRSAFLYSRDDAGVNTQRQPSRDAVPSSWTVSAQAAAKSAGVGMTALVALGVIFLLSRGRK